MAIKAKANEPLPAVLVSAIDGTGMDALTVAITEALQTSAIRGSMVLRPADGAARGWLHDYADVLDETVSSETGNIEMKVSFTLAQLGRFQSTFPAIALDTEVPS